MDPLGFLDMLSEIGNMMGNVSAFMPCPVHIHGMMIQASQQIDEETAEGIGNKLGDLLEEIVGLGPGYNLNHPSSTKFFNWLVDPQRTPQEFTYAVGPMAKYHFDYSGRFKNLYLGLIAAEALAIKGPVLEGSWEMAAWFVVWLNSDYRKEYNYGFPSNNLSDWIIHVMGCPDLCPSPSLRLEIMNMFGRMVYINDANVNDALNAVISACSFLPLCDREFFRFMVGDLTNVDLQTLTHILEKFIVDGYLLIFDEKLVNIYKNRVKSIINDASSSYGFNPIKYTGLEAENMINWFLDTTSLFAALELEKFKEDQFYPNQETRIEDVTHAVLVIVTNFKESCQSPNLVVETAHCVLYVLKLVLVVNISLKNERGIVYPKTLYDTHKLLVELSDKRYDSNIALSPVGTFLNREHQDELSIIRQKLGKYQPESDVICGLLYHCNIIE